jgi:predicted Ser/Thr protein kinase
VHCTIDQTVLTSDYTLRGVANIAPGQYLQLTQDAVGGGSRVLYNDPYDVTLGFSISLELNISSVDGDYGDGFSVAIAGSKNDFLNTAQSDGGNMNLLNLGNMAAVVFDIIFDQVYVCNLNATSVFGTKDGWVVEPNYFCVNAALATDENTKSIQITYEPNGSGTLWTVVVDGTTRQFTPGFELLVEPDNPYQYYIGFTGSNGNAHADKRILSWFANITSPCDTNNGNCATDAFCDHIGGGVVNCTCLGGFEGNGTVCVAIPPVAPPVEPPVAVPEAPIAIPISPPVEPPVEAPTNSIVNPPQEPGPEVIVPAVVVPVVAVGVAIFLAIYFGKKRQAEKQQKKSKDSDDDGTSVTMTASANATGIAPSAYATVPGNSRSSAQYNSLPEGVTGDNSEVGASDINPLGINPGEVDKRMHIPYKSLVFTKEIGAGSYGKVFLGEWRGAEVAIKVNNTVTDMEGFLAEAKLTLGIAPHPNLVQTFGVSLDGAYPCIVLEFCGGGSLDKLVFNKDVMTAAKRKEFALKIAYGLIHLHNNNIVHRDLAARNILLSTEGQPKVSDFGMSRIIQDEEAKGKTKTNVGPLRWMSPESIKDRSYSVKSDVWSYGILVYEIVSGMEPHANEDQLMVGVKIRDEAFTPAIPDDCDPTLREVMQMCWQKNPEDRPTMEEIVKYLRKH